MKEVQTSKNRHTCYVAVPVDADMKATIHDQQSAAALSCKLRLFVTLLLLGLSLHFMHEFIFHKQMSTFMHFGGPKPPCHHHVRINPGQDNIRPHVPPPPGIATESENPSTWKHFSFKDSSDDGKGSLSSDSSDSEDSSSDLDVWERIADYWVGSNDSSVDSKDSSDSSLDVWERIANVWEDSTDPSDDNEDEDVWERIADMWKLLSNENDAFSDSKDSSDSSDDSEGDIWERIADTWKVTSNENDATSADKKK